MKIERNYVESLEKIVRETEELNMLKDLDRRCRIYTPTDLRKYGLELEDDVKYAVAIHSLEFLDFIGSEMETDFVFTEDGELFTTSSGSVIAVHGDLERVLTWLQDNEPEDAGRWF
jgi:hypothetical protein